jgi:hypothetical protein
MNRREFLMNVWGVCACSVVPLATRRKQSVSTGCAWTHGAMGPLPQTTARSGNDQLDRALIAEVKRVDRVFQINPGYRFLQDMGGPNAYATTDTQVKGTSGTVLFGLTLLGQELQTSYGGAAVAGIAAHEGAHIFQFNNNLPARLTGPTAKRMELHADFLAGYYFARTGRSERSLIVFAESLFNKGDYKFNDRNHHGTPQQRVTAMRAGYAASQVDLYQASTRGIQHVENA